MNRRRRAFTLIEVLLSIALLGLVSGLVAGWIGAEARMIGVTESVRRDEVTMRWVRALRDDLYSAELVTRGAGSHAGSLVLFTRSVMPDDPDVAHEVEWRTDTDGRLTRAANGKERVAPVRGTSILIVPALAGSAPGAASHGVSLRLEDGRVVFVSFVDLESEE